jgi:hypothetical protein
MNYVTTNATIYIRLGGTNYTTVRSGQIFRISANVTNTGDFPDTFTLTIKGNSTAIPTNSTLVPSGASRIIFVNWSTSGMRPGRYTLTANVTVPGETIPNLIDNSVTFSFIIRPAGDANGDCVVNIVDLVIVASSFGKSRGDPGYNPIADLNNDGTINISDLAIVGSTFGQTC